MEPTYVDFTSLPCLPENAVVTTARDAFGKLGYLEVHEAGFIEVTFQVPADGCPELLLTVDTDGAEPDVRLNTQPVPVGSDATPLPPSLLVPGDNILYVAPRPESAQSLHLRHMGISPATDPDLAERSRLTDRDRDRFLPVRGEAKVFTFERIPLDGDGEPIPGALWLMFDHGYGADLRSLSWRDAEGNIASVGFSSNMAGMLGFWTDPAGRRFQIKGGRGIPTGELESPTPGTRPRFYRVSGKLRGLDLRLDAGSTPLPVQVDWTDEAGHHSSILFDDDWTAFTGYTHWGTGTLALPYEGRLADFSNTPDATPSPAPQPPGSWPGFVPAGVTELPAVDAADVDFAAIFAAHAPDRPVSPRIDLAGCLVQNDSDGSLSAGDPGRECAYICDNYPVGRFPVALTIEPLPEPEAAGRHSRVDRLAIAFSTRPPVRWENSCPETHWTGLGLFCVGTHEHVAIAHLVTHARRILDTHKLWANGCETVEEYTSKGYVFDLADYPTTPDPTAYRDGWYALPDHAKGGVVLGILTDHEQGDEYTYGCVGYDGDGHIAAYVHVFRPDDY
ncbi:hypothetical protein P8605_00065 [Streptomyces sp. T-3]|nr:hypothetical protein [Streptomyces sp. T-3]